MAPSCVTHEVPLTVIEPVLVVTFVLDTKVPQAVLSPFAMPVIVT